MIEVTRELVGAGTDVFALHVKGNSMIDAMISDGDIVVMQSTQTASNGDMVAAWIADREETTLKKFYLENGKVRLQPANPSMDPIYVDPGQVQIQGRVVAVIRNLN
jgi:repressor LexA